MQKLLNEGDLDELLNSTSTMSCIIYHFLKNSKNNFDINNCLLKLTSGKVPERNGFEEITYEKLFNHKKIHKKYN